MFYLAVDPRNDKLIRNASCAGLRPVCDDPIYPEYALTLCETCPVKRTCLDVVDPAYSFFDGVAGGLVWLEGRLSRDHHAPGTVGEKFGEVHQFLSQEYALDGALQVTGYFFQKLSVFLLKALPVFLVQNQNGAGGLLAGQALDGDA